MKICILTIATNKYIQFVEKLYDNIEEHFLNGHEIEGIICISYTNDIPHSVKELDMMSELAHMKEEKKIAIAYTVWSRKRGAGKEIINKVLEHAKAQGIERVVTLSPLTPMATHFHIRNGAKQISINDTSQNFEYAV